MTPYRTECCYVVLLWGRFCNSDFVFLNLLLSMLFCFEAQWISSCGIRWRYWKGSPPPNSRRAHYAIHVMRVLSRRVFHVLIIVCHFYPLTIWALENQEKKVFAWEPFQSVFMSDDGPFANFVISKIFHVFSNNHCLHKKSTTDEKLRYIPFKRW